jgi:hypothetical protein
LQFLRRASFGGVLAASAFAADEVSAQVTLPPNLTIGMETIMPGLLEGRVPGAFDTTTPNPGDRGVVLEPIMGQTTGGNGAEPWPDNITYIYNGEMNFPNNTGAGISQFAFAEHIDDSTLILIDGVEVLRNTQWDLANTTGVLSLPAGWHDVEFRFGQGVGGAGPHNGQGWPADFGFGVDFTLPIDTTVPPLPGPFQRPVDPGNATVFRVRTFNTDTSRDNQNVNVTANATLTILQGRVVPFGSLTVADGTTLTVDSRTTATFTQTNVGPASTFNITDGEIVTGPLRSSGAVTSLTKSGPGELTIPTGAGSNVASIGATNVNGGTLSIGVSGAGTSIGTGPINLDGGTLGLANDVAVPNGPGVFNTTGRFYLDDDIFNPILPGGPDSTNGVGWAGLDNRSNLDSRLAGRTPLATVTVEKSINFPHGNGNLVDGGTNDNPDEIFNQEGGNLGVSLRGDQPFVTTFTGQLNVTSAGPTGFGMASNDGSVLFLDLDQGAGTNWVKVADNNRFTGTGGGNFQEHGTAGNGGDPGNPPIPQPAMPNLSAGIYDYAIGWFNSPEADDPDPEAGIELFWVPAGGTRGIVPFAAGGPVTLNNALNVSGASGINVDAPSATLANLNMAPGSSLAVTGNQLTTAVTATGAGTVSIGSLTGPPVRVTALNDGGNAVNFAAGPGRAELTNVSGPTIGATSTIGTVTGGTLIATAGATSDSLGNAQVRLAGGTLQVRGDGNLPLLPTGAGLHAVTGDFFNSGLTFNQSHTAGRTDPTSNGWSVFASVDAMNATLNPLTPAFNDVPINVPLNFPGDPNDLGGGGNDDEGGNIFGQSGIGVDLGNAPDINFVARFVGKLNVTQSGPTRFTIGTTDGGVMFIDLDTGPGTNWALVVDNNRYGGVDMDDHEVRGTGIAGDPPIAQMPAPNLAAGAYDFVVGFSGHNDESDGIPSPSNNEAGIEVRWTPAGGAESIIPVAPSGPALNFGNNIQVTENSTIDLGTTAFSAAFGNVNIDSGRTLTSTGGALTGGLKITGSIDGMGTLRAATNHTVEFTRSGAASSGAPNLQVDPAGSLRFNPGNGNTFGGSAVATIANDGLLHAASGITDLAGANLTSPNPDGAILSPGLSAVTGDFYRNGLVFNQSHTAGRTDPTSNGWSAFASVAAMDAALNPLTPAFNDVPINVPLNFPGDPNDLAGGGNDDEGGNIFGQSGIGVDLGNIPDINFATRFNGKLNVAQPGVTEFEVGSNSGGVMFIDLDQGPGTNWLLVADNNRFSSDGDNYVTRGSNDPDNPPITQVPPPDLNVGAYDFVVGFFGHNDESDGLPVPSNNEAGIEVRWTPAGGAETIIPVARLAPPSVVQVDSGATLRLGSMVNPGTVNVAAMGRLELHGATSKIDVSRLNLAGTPAAPTATLDVTDSALVLEYTDEASNPSADVRSRIVAARGGTDLLGTWDGKGITSSNATADPSTFSVGFANNADLPLGSYTEFRGQPVDDTSVLIRGTLIGDANLDGIVGDEDVTIVGATFGMTSGATWALGDFTYDGAVDDADVTLVSALYNPAAPPVGAPPLGAAGAVAAVPEPATWLMLALGGLGAGLFGWRRRKTQP